MRQKFITKCDVYFKFRQYKGFTDLEFNSFSMLSSKLLLDVRIFEAKPGVILTEMYSVVSLLFAKRNINV